MGGEGWGVGEYRRERPAIKIIEGIMNQSHSTKKHHHAAPPPLTSLSDRINVNVVLLFFRRLCFHRLHFELAGRG